MKAEAAGPTTFALLGVLLTVALAGEPAEAHAQMLRTLFQRGGPGESRPLGTVVAVRVDTADGRILARDDSSRVHVFDRWGVRLDRADGEAAWEAVGAAGPTAMGADAAAREGAAGLRVSPGTRVAVSADSSAVRILRDRQGGPPDAHSFELPAREGEGAGSRFRIHRLLADGRGRAWLRVCPVEGCDDPERWLLVTPAPDSTPEAPPGLSGMVLPVRYRLEAVVGPRLIGVQGAPGRHALHVLEMYETGGTAPGGR